MLALVTNAASPCLLPRQVKDGLVRRLVARTRTLWADVCNAWCWSTGSEAPVVHRALQATGKEYSCRIWKTLRRPQIARITA